jgi:hypothetical protein
VARVPAVAAPRGEWFQVLVAIRLLHNAAGDRPEHRAATRRSGPCRLLALDKALRETTKFLKNPSLESTVRNPLWHV